MFLNVVLNILYCDIIRLFTVNFVKKIFFSNKFYFKINFNIIWRPYNIFIIVFGIQQLNKLWKKTFKTIHQLSCFVGHPVHNRITSRIFTVFMFRHQIKLIVFFSSINYSNVWKYTERMFDHINFTRRVSFIWRISPFCLIKSLFVLYCVTC